MDVRNIALDDLPRILAALAAQREACSKATAKRIDESCVEQWVAAGKPGVMINNSVALFYDIEPPIYGHRGGNILVEVLLLRIGRDHTSMGMIDKVMTTIAKANCCDGILVATGLSSRDESLARAYQRFGYEVESFSLFKEITQ